MNGEHDVSRDNGGIHVGEVPSIVGAYPRLFTLAADDEEDARAEGVVRGLRNLCTRLGLSIAQILNGCLLTAVGATRAASMMRSIAACGSSASESARQENRS